MTPLSQLWQSVAWLYCMFLFPHNCTRSINTYTSLIATAVKSPHSCAKSVVWYITPLIITAVKHCSVTQGHYLMWHPHQSPTLTFRWPQGSTNCRLGIRPVTGWTLWSPKQPWETDLDVTLNSDPVLHWVPWSPGLEVQKLDQKLIITIKIGLCLSGVSISTYYLNLFTINNPNCITVQN